ncbi:hypothetical protein [Plantactinospora sp. B5E13]|uniref:hypothetical protein n=1 Tax=Plantactinospora sp. B5E13 TaxID=3153758 RepID=UPI00325DC74E
MLTRRTLAIGAATLLVLAAALAPGGPALADPGANCPPGQDNCDVFDNENGNTGGGSGNGSGNGSGGGGGPRVCTKDNGETVPCYDSIRGWFNSADDCYYKVQEPQSPQTPPGQTSYLKSCGSGGAVNAETVFLDDPPPGFDPPDPEELARDLLGRVLRTPPQIRTAPDEAPGLVGVPVWLYDAGSWAPVEDSAGEGGVTVWIEATPTRIVWEMGDGERKTCRSAGVAFRSGVHDPRRPPGNACTHRYAQPSDDVDGGKYRITATRYYTVRWGSNVAGEGEPFEGVSSPQATTTIQIDELQVVTR